MLTPKAHKSFLVLIQLLLVAVTGFSQQSIILDSFDAFYKNEKVYLNWVISSGKNCNGTKILRATDTLHFTQIGNIEGICGNPTSPQPFSFTDEDPVKNRINYYRLELGVTGFSDIVSIETIALSEEGYQVRPNPASISTKIYFDNSTKKEYQFLLYSINGLLVTTLSTRKNHFDLNVTDFPSGMYVFIISFQDGVTLTKGKLMVQE